MKIKSLSIFIITAIVVSFYSFAYCAETSEISVNDTYKKIYWLLKENTGENYVTTIRYGADSLNYAVEILNNAPDSLETFLSMFLINDVFKTCDDNGINILYDSIKDKHIQHFDDVDFDPGEKLMFLIMYSAGCGAKSSEEQGENNLKVIQILNSMKENCKNKNYAALANAALFKMKNKEKRVEYIKFFLDNFPNHSAFPTVKLLYITEQYLNDTPQQCIEEINKLIVQYGKNKMPNGWNFSSDCYQNMISCYIKLRDYDNAMKYYEIVKNEAPGSWNLEKIKKCIDEIK